MVFIKSLFESLVAIGTFWPKMSHDRQTGLMKISSIRVAIYSLPVIIININAKVESRILCSFELSETWFWKVLRDVGSLPQGRWSSHKPGTTRETAWYLHIICTSLSRQDWDSTIIFLTLLDINREWSWDTSVDINGLPPPAGKIAIIWSRK